MKTIKLSIFLLISLWAKAQSTDVTLFTEDGERFYFTINGKKVNDTPESRVEALNITGDFAQIKITFETAGAPELKQNMMLEADMSMTAIIKKNKKGKYVFRPISSSPKSNSSEQTVSISSTGQQTVSNTTNTTETVYKEESSSSLLDFKVNKNGSASLKVNMPSDFEIENNRPENEGNYGSSSGSSRTISNGSSITARVEGKKITLSDGRTLDWKYTKTKNLLGVEIEMLEPVGAQVVISYDGNIAKETEIPFFYREPDSKKNKAYFKLTVRETNEATWSVKLQHSNNNRLLINNLLSGGSQSSSHTSETTLVQNTCDGISNSNFDRALASINNKSFADEKMVVAKQIIKANCFYVVQVAKLMESFTYEEDRISIAKTAHAKTIDQNNYYQLNDVFTYSDSVDELNTFLESQN